MRKPISHVYRQVAQRWGDRRFVRLCGPSGHAMTPPGASLRTSALPAKGGGY